VDRVVFAGSVVRRDFDWESMKRSKRVRGVRNYVATADWVIGFFPYFFELLNYSDIGGAGLLGFTSGEAEEVRYVVGEHGAAIESQNLGDMAQFLIGPEDVPVSRTKLSGSQNGFVLTVARICWVIWLALAIILTYCGYILAFSWKVNLIRPWPRLILYVGTVALILNTV
jgi:hypothetical protein